MKSSNGIIMTVLNKTAMNGSLFCGTETFYTRMNECQLFESLWLKMFYESSEQNIRTYESLIRLLCICLLAMNFMTNEFNTMFCTAV